MADGDAVFKGIVGHAARDHTDDAAAHYARGSIDRGVDGAAINDSH